MLSENDAQPPVISFGEPTWTVLPRVSAAVYPTLLALRTDDELHFDHAHDVIPFVVSFQ